MPRSFLALSLVLALVLALAMGASPAAAEGIKATIYKSPECGCCHGYTDHLRDAGFEVTVKDMDDVSPVKEYFGIDGELWSCHTVIIGGYAIEGHVPAEVIDRLLAENPKIKGIALPGMPEGSPGMSGAKEETFIYYTITDGEPEVWFKQ